jgi:hypothetical protein
MNKVQKMSKSVYKKIHQGYQGLVDGLDGLGLFGNNESENYRQDKLLSKQSKLKQSKLLSKQHNKCSNRDHRSQRHTLEQDQEQYQEHDQEHGFFHQNMRSGMDRNMNLNVNKSENGWPGLSYDHIDDQVDVNPWENNWNHSNQYHSNQYHSNQYQHLRHHGKKQQYSNQRSRE